MSTQDSSPLVTRIQEALLAGDSPAQALVRVGSMPWIDTVHEVDRNAVAMADYAADPQSPGAFIDPHAGQRVIYWGIPDTPGDPVIVGILWDETSASRFFRARVLAP